MPAAPQGVVIEPNGQTVVVTFVELGGGTPTVYADRNGQSTIALPATITVRTKFFFEVGTVYTVSCKVSGLENANGAGGTATVDLTGGGVASLGVSTPVETPTVASGTYAKVARATFRSGRKWLFAGDSITNGSNASNFSFSYSRQACHGVGTLYAAADSVEAGTAGYTSAQLLAYLPSLLSTYTPDAVHIQIGTNDSGLGVTLATFQTNVLALIALCKQAGCAVTIGTVPPRTSSSGLIATARPLIAAYNMWLRMVMPGLGVELAEVYGALVDTTSGDMLAAYNTANPDGTGGAGDGVHPNTAGHTKIANAVASAMLRTMPTTRSALVNSVVPTNLLANPLMVSAGSDPTGSAAAIATGTAPVRSMVADAAGFLAAGQFAQVDLTAAATSSFGREFGVPSGWAVGDTLIITGQIEVADLSGGWEAAIAAATANAGFFIINQSAAVIANSMDRCAGRLLSSGLYAIGPIFMPFVVPVGTTSMTFRYKIDAPNGLHVQARFGAIGLFNATALGIAAGVSSMTNVDGP